MAPQTPQTPPLAPATAVNGSSSSTTTTNDVIDQQTTDSPQTPQETDSVIIVRALYPYVSEDPNTISLSFDTDDLIQVVTQLDSGWWYGFCNQARGWFPSNFVEEITQSDLEDDSEEGDEDRSDDNDNTEEMHDHDHDTNGHHAHVLEHDLDDQDLTDSDEETASLPIPPSLPPLSLLQLCHPSHPYMHISISLSIHAVHPSPLFHNSLSLSLSLRPLPSCTCLLLGPVRSLPLLLDSTPFYLFYSLGTFEIHSNLLERSSSGSSILEKREGRQNRVQSNQQKTISKHSQHTFCSCPRSMRLPPSFLCIHKQRRENERLRNAAFYPLDMNGQVGDTFTTRPPFLGRSCLRVI